MPPNNPYGSTPPPDYSFITSPSAPAPQRRLPLPGGNSMLGRVILVAVALIVFLILFSVIRGLLSGPSSLPEFVGVVQDQAEIVHLSTNALLQQNISTPNRNFAETAQLSLTTAQSKTISYLKNNGKKVGTKQLNLKVSSSLDSQLTAAQTSGTFDATFAQVMKSQLNTYQRDLQTTYSLTKGPKGRALLTAQYKQANLLLTQLDAQYQ